MDSEGAQRLAAEVLSRILSDNAIRHAFIGGFALRMLEHDRKTDDIDVEVDILPGEQPREHLIQLILGADSRFSVKALGKLFFTPLENPDLSVPVETLPVGTLNLPTSLLTVSPGDGTVPILLPQVLVLTKMKRLSHIIDSTRPKSQRKAENDASDVVFLLRYLVDKKQKIDYAAYQAKHPERLYEATGIVARA